MAKPVGYGGRDYPDFGISDTFQTKYVMSDMGELAARLGAPNVFDRTGTLIWFEQFAYGLNNWTLSSASNGIDPFLIAYPYLYKPYAVKLSGTSGSTGSSTMLVTLPFPYESPLGIEFAYMPDIRATELDVVIQLYTGSKYYASSVSFKLQTGIIKVGLQGGFTKEVYSDPLGYRLNNVYNITKIVLDLANQEYNRIMFNKYNIDVKDIGFHVGTSTLRPKLTLLFRLESAATYDESLLIDNIILTLDEPL